MLSSKVHSQRNAPFSWENEPGIRKAAPPHHRQQPPRKLPPPPCPLDNSRVSYHDLRVPLPPCAFHQPSRSRRSSAKKIDDPFLIAYKEVTRSTGTKKGDQRFGGSVMNIFSCKQSSSCGVELSQLPVSRSFRD
ncbi:hypothetical protein AAHA92_23187 [Salvia divinorum]|uniref:Uncharacterized protein n=1 Tax=Salvia divinorum TaxID=28513 RepID=A0ABD1GR54_SALDI